MTLLAKQDSLQKCGTVRAASEVRFYVVIVKVPNGADLLGVVRAGR
jgi:hypothetical protein